jgi:hypothetical protein
MSNYNVPPINPKHEVMVGWDPQLNTFFAHVIDSTKAEDEWGRDVFWIGCTPNEIHGIETIKRNLEPYANIPEGTLSRMYGDTNT